MSSTMKSGFIFSLVLGFLIGSVALYAEGGVLKAVMTLDKKQISQSADRVIQVSAISADGHIEGTEGKEKKWFLFSEIKEISFDLATHKHTVIDLKGEKHFLTWGLIKSENTATAVTFKSFDEKSKTEKSESVSPSEIKSLVFETEKPADKTSDQEPPAKK